MVAQRRSVDFSQWSEVWSEENRKSENRLAVSGVQGLTKNRGIDPMSKKKPKQAGICERKRHNRTYYFAEISGKQVGLGCNLDAAKAKYAQKIAETVARAKFASQVLSWFSVNWNFRFAS
jgi:hypothetical protein